MGLSKSSKSTGQVTLFVSSSSGWFPWSIFSWLVLGSGATLLAAIILSGAKLIVDPYSPNWLKTTFPVLAIGLEAVPQTPDEIEAEMRDQGINPGHPLPWPSANQPEAWFYPILTADGKSIRELWTYRVRGAQLQRSDRVMIRPIKESFITTPLVGTASQVASVDSDAILSSVNLMMGGTGKLGERPWLLLEGKRRYGNTGIRYGQILSYQPGAQRLHRLLNWSSPAGQSPQWRMDAEGQQQLVVNQTVGLRPNLLLYQIVPNDPPQLQEISLYRSVYGAEADSTSSLYDNALRLAQGSVWSHSLQMMQSAKKSLGADWLPAAQGQLDLIQLHAELTRVQAERTWSSQHQHILAYLIDGQWEQALMVIEAKPTLYAPLIKRLERDFDPLWRGVTVHLKVHPYDGAAQVWGALLVTARQSPQAGQDWLKKQSRSKPALARLKAAGARSLASATVVMKNGTEDSPAVLPTATEPGRYRRMVGQARAIDTPGGGWLRSQSLSSLPPGQRWYRIDIQLLQDSSGWGLPPALAAAAFWSESLALRSQLQLFDREHRSVAGLTVYGVQATGTGLSLLAVAADSDAGLVATSDSLQWLTSLPWQAAPLPDVLSSIPPDLSLDVPSDQDALGETVAVATTGSIESLMVDAIGRHFGLTLEQTALLYPHLQYASLDLTGDVAPEHLFHLGTGVELPENLPPLPTDKTIIFSNVGGLLYSDLGQRQSLLALTIGRPDQPVTLLLNQAGRYGLTAL